MSDCYVYIMQSVRLELVKIGISDDPQRRLAEVRRGNPDEVELFFCLKMPGRTQARDVEAAFHKVRGGDRVRGEWFRLKPEVAYYLLVLALVSYLDWGGVDREMFEPIMITCGLSASVAAGAIKTLEEEVRH